jgi:uncharacterized protein (TIGR00369 family)
MTQTQPEASPDDLAGSRMRSYSWGDPAAAAAMLGRRSGIETLRAVGAGELPPPPIMSTLDVSGVAFEVGTATFRLVPQEFHYNPLGTVHGGVIATLLDSAAGCAVHSVLGAGEGYTSLDLTTKYLRPVTTATGEVTATGTVLSRGSRTALAQAQLTDARGRVLAHATSSCLIFPVPAGD